MFSTNPKQFPIADIRSPHDPTREVRAAFPLHRDEGSASTAAVYFELEPGKRLGTHVDSAEEVLVVLEGEIEAVVGEERGRVPAGGIALVPSMVPHDVRNVGEGVARVYGIFSSNTTVSVFEEPFSAMGGPATRVAGTPPPQLEEEPVAEKAVAGASVGVGA